ncbi:DNA invertase, partial [Escherichia coli]|nr:DNA invertase [Escherichia coli]
TERAHQQAAQNLPPNQRFHAALTM